MGGGNAAQSRNFLIEFREWETKFEYFKKKEDEIFTLVRGLAGMVQDEFFFELMDKINDTVPLITQSIKFNSLHLHFCLFELIKYGTIEEIKTELLGKFNTTKYFGRLTYNSELQINKGFEYYILVHDVRSPELKNCRQFCTFAVEEYKHNFKTNIKTHDYGRIKRLFNYHSDVAKDKYN